jgi:hypothetical protein
MPQNDRPPLPYVVLFVTLAVGGVSLLPSGLSLWIKGLVILAMVGVGLLGARAADRRS